MKNITILVEAYSLNPNHYQLQVKNFDHQEEVYLITEVKDGIVDDAFHTFLTGLKEEDVDLQTVYTPLWLSKIIQREIEQVFPNLKTLIDYNVVSP